jgi:hypothetical protein
VGIDKSSTAIKPDAVTLILQRVENIDRASRLFPESTQQIEQPYNPYDLVLLLGPDITHRHTVSSCAINCGHPNDLARLDLRMKASTSSSTSQTTTRIASSRCQMTMSWTQKPHFRQNEQAHRPLLPDPLQQLVVVQLGY